MALMMSCHLGSDLMSKKEVYSRYKNEKRCRNCGSRLIGDRKDKCLCTKCAKKHSQYVKENTLFFRQHNLCPRCGKVSLEGDEKNCPECRAKLWEYRTQYIKEHPEFIQKKYEKEREQRLFRKENSLCTYCGEPLQDTRFSSCEKCRIKRRVYSERFRKKAIV